MTDIALIIVAVIFVSAFTAYLIWLFKTRKKRRIKREKRKIKQKIVKLSNGSVKLTPEEFFALRNKSFGGRGNPQYSKTCGFKGVYVLYNATKNKYYVGQGHDVLNRVNMHFTGKGNGDVYADYKYGDEFTVSIMALKKSGFKTLNELERHTIAFYNARSEGYNKTAGNADRKHK